MPRLFALDHAFPQPIVAALAPAFAGEAELVPVVAIDHRMIELDDWQLLLALHHHTRPWDGLITPDASMLALPRELSVLMHTKLSLVAAEGAGHDPVRATGLVLTHLSSVCRRTRADRAQIWHLRAGERLPVDPMDEVTRAAEHRSMTVGELLAEGRLPRADLDRDPLA